MRPTTPIQTTEPMRAATPTRSFDAATHAFWHGSAPMSYVLGVAGPDELFVRADGCWLTDAAGRRFLDARSGIANMILGYDRHDIAEAMYRQALELPFVCTLRYDRPASVTVDYANALAAVAPDGLRRVRFTHTGSSAVEAALLMARRYHRNLGRSERLYVVGLGDSYHGSTLMTMAASGQPMLHEGYGPMPSGFCHVAPPDMRECGRCSGNEDSHPSCADVIIEEITELGPDRVAALVLEPVHGLSGVPLPAHLLREIRTFCDRHDILVIFDEVFSGLGRMGPMFAAELSGVSPDILCLSKTLTAGYAPLGAVLATDRIYDTFNQTGRYFAHGSSTDAHPIACAAGLVTLRALTVEGVLEQANRMGRRLAEGLDRELSGCPFVRRVRVIGSYIGIDVDCPDEFMAMMNMKRHLQSRCETAGVLIDYTPYTVMLVPAYTMPDEDVDTVVERVATVLHDFRPEDVDPSTLRPPAASGRR